MAPSTPSPGNQRENRVMTDSGSSWSKDQSAYFNISELSMRPESPPSLLLSLDSSKAVISRDLLQQFSVVTTRKLTESTHADLLFSTTGNNTSQNYGTVLGPFLALIATIKEAPYVPKTGQRPQRERKGVDRGGMVSTVEAVEPGSSEEDSPKSDKERRVDPSYSNESQMTDKSAHLARSKAEITTQVMLYLLCQAVFEGSSLGTRGQNPSRAKTSEHRLEWSVAGKRFDIRSPKVRCVSINDGSLFWKNFSPEGYWVTGQPLAYCSIETKARLLHWDEDEIEGETSDLVKAQEASQMIGMMCERLRAAAVKQNRVVDADKLSEYDRTVFLISGAQRTMFLKVAVFTPEYIKHFFQNCLVPPPPPPADNNKDDDPFADDGRNTAGLSSQLDKLRLNDESPPTLEIYRTNGYDLSRGDSLREAADALLAMGVYLEENGPLLKDIPTAN